MAAAPRLVSFASGLRPMAKKCSVQSSGIGLIPAELDGIISMHLIESDPTLSKPLGDDAAASITGAGDWYVLIDGTDVAAISAAIAARFSDAAAFKPAIPVVIRDLPFDVGSGEERYRAGMISFCDAALPHETHGVRVYSTQDG